MREHKTTETGSSWKGISTLDLSIENIITAIQDWLDGNFAPGSAPRATRVSYDYAKQKYVVTLEGNDTNEVSP